MRKGLLFGIFAFVIALSAIFFVLSSEKAVVLHPKGFLAHHERAIMIFQFILMLIIIIPTFIVLFLVAWKYRSTNKKAHYEPEKKAKTLSEVILWLIPVPIVGVMVVFTWDVTHKYDPFVPLQSELTPLRIQVLALDWKWLFIYPEQKIATVNFVQFPTKRPINFALAADGSPMNSFWIPQLSGQIYSMTGMVTPLPLMANETGVYTGRAAEINGEGYASMTFVAQASTEAEFEKWVETVKKSAQRLTEKTYQELIKPSEDYPFTFYSYVEDDLFERMVMKYMHPPKKS